MAFDRNPGKQQKAELEALRQALEREQAKNRELSRSLENTECALDAAQQGEAEARSEYENAEHVHDVTLRELRETIESELLPPLNSDLAKARSEITRLEAEREKAKELPSHMLAIAGLLELLLDKERPRYDQGRAAQAIEDRHHWYGASASQLTKIFPLAKAAAKKADGEVNVKTESL